MNDVAVILFNLGGPSDLKAVRPFLLNLFMDPAILRMPRFFRFLLAHLITALRTKKAMAIYERMGGASPLLANTNAQARALETHLRAKGITANVFVCMRYWHPMADEVARAVKATNPKRIVLLPLYPQCSTTTTTSSLDDWKTAWAKITPATATESPVETLEIGCYPDDPAIIDAFCTLAIPTLREASAHGRPALLYSAHGLPQSIIDEGDPYELQVELTAKRITEKLHAELGDIFDPIVCYQSRVGPKKWLGPATDTVITEAAQKAQPLVVLPVAFVSDHSETLVELDLDYRDLALSQGAPFYGRVPSLGTHPLFIENLSARVQGTLNGNTYPKYCTNGMQCVCYPRSLTNR
jgi:ferrochelatase